MDAMTPRLLTSDDIPQCLELSGEAGWNQTARDWHRLIALEPQGCFGIDAGGRLAATATVVCYGTDLAWIGMVLVRIACRGQGLARTLLQTALDVTAARRIACVKLDATDLGEPVYRKLGFAVECGVERWVRQPGESLPLADAPGYRFDAEADRAAFGADRAMLLWMLEREETFGAADGSFALGRPGVNAAFFGPSVVCSDESGRRLLNAFLVQHAAEPVYWDRFSENAARQGAPFGFAPWRHLKRMYRGQLASGDPSRQFALAGFELG
jgi:GNAT superfamily N-acetyltransferase